MIAYFFQVFMEIFQHVHTSCSNMSRYDVHLVSSSVTTHIPSLYWRVLNIDPVGAQLKGSQNHSPWLCPCPSSSVLLSPKTHTWDSSSNACPRVPGHRLRSIQGSASSQVTLSQWWMGGTRENKLSASGLLCPMPESPSGTKEGLQDNATGKRGKFITDSSQGPLPHPTQWCRSESLEPKLLQKFIGGAHAVGLSGLVTSLQSNFIGQNFRAGATFLGVSARFLIS